jgi:hypothetical protein
MERVTSSKSLLVLNGLHGVISQKKDPFITAVRTSNPIYKLSSYLTGNTSSPVQRQSLFTARIIWNT